MQVVEPIKTASADGRDLLLPEGALVHLDDVRGRSQAVLHHKLSKMSYSGAIRFNFYTIILGQ